MKSYNAEVRMPEKPCYCDGKPIPIKPPSAKQAFFDREKIKLSDLADINIIEAPNLA